MIIYTIMVVRDRSADTFSTPTFHTSVGAAARAFTDEINRNAPDNVMFNHPEDFDLYECGRYTDETALFECYPPRQVLIGKDVSVKNR